MSVMQNVLCVSVKHYFLYTIFEIRTDFEINKYKYHRRLNVGLAVYTAADLGA